MYTISIHTALAGCDSKSRYIDTETGISIHTALAGCDLRIWKMAKKAKLFQSTQPSQAVTLREEQPMNIFKISIHTALAGCDMYKMSSRR